MQQNSPNFSMEQAMQLMNTDAGKRLLAILQNSNDPGLRQAMEQASKGDMEQARKALSNITASQEVQALLRQLGGK